MDTETSVDAPAESRAERHLRLLQELAEIGMDIARAVRAEALAEDDPAERAPSRFGRSDPGRTIPRKTRHRHADALSCWKSPPPCLHLFARLPTPRESPPSP